MTNAVDPRLLSERPRRARARARAQAHQRLGTFPKRAVHRTAHGNPVAQPKPYDHLSQQASLYSGQRPSPRPRDVGEAAGAVTRGDIRLPQERSSEDRRKGGLTTEYNEFAELSRQTVEFLESDMTTVRETLHDVVYDDDGVNGDRDALGRITKKTEWIVQGDTPDPGGAARPLASRTYDYGYNPEGRPWLESVAVDGNVVSSYSYDDNGNRTAAELSWSQLGYDSSFDVSLSEADTEYDSADKLLTYGTKSYTWNNFGQLESMTDSDPNGDGDTSDSEVTFYQYDLFGNLLRVDLPDGRAIEYDVDGAGRRVGRRELDENGDEISFRGWIYRDLLRPIAEVDAQGNVVARYVYPEGELQNVPEYIIRLDSAGTESGVYSLVADQLGSVRMVVDLDTGEIVQRLQYDTWGRVIEDTNPGFQPFGYAGGIADRDHHLTRFGVRDYDAGLGRWTARDPRGFNGEQWNMYVYVWGDPMNKTDPTGEVFFVGAAIGAGINLGSQLLDNGGRLECVDVSDVIVAAAFGAVSGGVGAGIKGLATSTGMKIGLGALAGAEIGAVKSIATSAVDTAQGDPADLSAEEIGKAATGGALSGGFGGSGLVDRIKRFAGF